MFAFRAAMTVTVGADLRETVHEFVLVFGKLVIGLGERNLVLELILLGLSLSQRVIALHLYTVNIVGEDGADNERLVESVAHCILFLSF